MSTKKHDEEIPDFRTVKPESDEEDQLQRTFEVMRGGGREWDRLRGSIAFTWEGYMKQKYPTLGKMLDSVEEGHAKEGEKTKQVEGGSTGRMPADLRKPEISTDEINKLTNGLDELKLFAVCAENLRHAIDGDGAYGRLFDWPSFHKNPEKGPEMWASEELWPFLMTVEQRLPDLHKRLKDALIECWEEFYSIERLSEKSEQARGEEWRKTLAAEEGSEVPDFRSIKPDTDQEDQLQRVFEVMHLGGKNWSFLEKAITTAWEDNMRVIEEGRAIWERGRIQRPEEPEQAGA